mmetsp:Transcript_5421/g.7976  ORF Transcript_5421/g.7976 Transcript_5421/m.7976 type:complete len:872 (-) Transcript_5421:1928-4543(-)
MEQPPYGSILDWSGVRILFDCGMDNMLSEEYCERLEKVSEEDIDLILLSHHETRHLGGLVFLRKMFGLKAPIYATQPCQKLGKLAMIELWRSLRASLGRTSLKFNLQDIHQVFNEIRTLKFDQPLQIKNRQSKMTIVTAHRVGYTAGGAWWRIESSGYAISYCVDINRRNELHLQGADFSSLSETDILITDCEAMARTSKKKNVLSERNTLTKLTSSPRDILVHRVVETLRTGGNVLIPIEPTSRGIEIALILNNAWRKMKLSGAYSLIFCHSTIERVLDISRCQLEWMHHDMQRAFDRGGGKQHQIDSSWHPLALEFFEFFTHVHEVIQNKTKQQKCILASSADLSTGASAAFLRSWASDPKNLILQTSRDFLPTTTRMYHGRHGTIKKLHAEARDAFLAAVSAKNAEIKRIKQRRIQAEQLAKGLFLFDTPPTTVPTEEEQIIKQDIEKENIVAGQNKTIIETQNNHEQNKAQEKRLQETTALLEKFATPWYLCFPSPPPPPEIDNYGIELPQQIIDALKKAKSTLFGLETRQGYGYLGDGATFSNPSKQAPRLVKSGNQLASKNKVSQHKPLDVSLPAELVAAMEEEKEAIPIDIAYDDEASDTEEPEPVERRTHMIEFEIKAQLIFLPQLDGLCDEQEIKHTLISLRPRALILLPSKQDEEKNLINFAQSLAHNWRPELVTALIDTHFLDLNNLFSHSIGRLHAQLDADILRDLRLQGRSVGDGFTLLRLPQSLSLASINDESQLLLSRLDASIHPLPPEENDEIPEPKKKKSRLDSSSVENDQQTKIQPALWISSKDLVLTSLKDAIQTNGISAEIKAGSLVCASNIIIRKQDIRNSKRHLLIIDGPISPAYFAVAAILKKQFTLV